MKDVFGAPQSVLIFGGNSEIAMAILKKLLSLNRVQYLYLVTRDSQWSHRDKFSLISNFSSVQVQVFKMAEFSIEKSLSDRKLDICIVATGFLPQANQLSISNVTQSFEANLSLPAQYVTEAALRMKEQGYGMIVALSSIAAVRVRPDNWIYGVAKAAYDQFLLQIIPTLKDTGVTLLILRPGMVRTKMSAHLKEAPLTVDPDVVAEAVMKNLRSESRVVWIPSKIKVIALILKVLPMWLLKRLKQ
jgi:decaprenylphospho-beta-D-erythro-pentofuranosid-2-ulose 2-reductase